MEQRTRMLYACDKNGKLIHVDRVPNGNACNCFCPSCKEPVSARQGNVNAHSFAHISKKNCEYAVQTAIHLLAKEIIKSGCKITLPPAISVEVDRSSGGRILKCGDLSIHLPKARKDLAGGSVVFEPYVIDSNDSSVSVSLEKSEGDFIPDITVSQNTPRGIRKILIEIYVTHKVDEKKKAKVRQDSLAMVEYDLSCYEGDVSEDRLRQVFELGENCRWINNPKADSKFKTIENELKGKIKSYPIYERERYITMHGGCTFDDSPGDYVIKNPPCGGLINARDICTRDIAPCKECVFFSGIASDPIKENSYSYKTSSALWCTLRPVK